MKDIKSRNGKHDFRIPLLKCVDIPKIGINDLLVVHDFVRPAVSDLLAMVEHYNPVRNSHDNAHHMLDDEDRRPPYPDIPDEIDGFLALFRVEAGGELI